MTDFLGEWQAWRDAREQRLRDPRGWLAITAIHWLTFTPQRFDDVPGEWYCDEHGVAVALGQGETLTAGSTVLTEGTHQFGPLDEIGLTVAFGNAVAQVAARDGRFIVRPRHPDSPNLRAYRGTPCYPPDPDWRLPARFEAYPAPEGEAVGEVVFEYDGTEHRLIAWGEDDGSLWILFRDATSGVTTYPANRQLLTAPRRPTAAWTSISTGRSTCRAPTPTSPPARCPRRPTRCRSKSRRASRYRRCPRPECLPPRPGHR